MPKRGCTGEDCVSSSHSSKKPRSLSEPCSTGLFEKFRFSGCVNGSGSAVTSPANIPSPDSLPASSALSAISVARCKLHSPLRELAKSFTTCSPVTTKKPSTSVKKKLTAGPGSTPAKQCLPPIVGACELYPAPWLLLLGSAPGEASLAAQEYYAHKQNQFWPVIADTLNLDAKHDFLALPYSTRVELLKQAGVAMWDMCQHFHRSGSLDSNLRCEVVNDVGALLAEHPSIHVVGLNGGAASRLFHKHVVKAGRLPRSQEGQRPLKIVTLPSTSSAHAMSQAVTRKSSTWKDSLLQTT